MDTTQQAGMVVSYENAGVMMMDTTLGHRRHLTPWDAMSLANALRFHATTWPHFGTCTSCAAPLAWAVTDKGKRMPLDAGDHPEGNMVAYRVDGKLVVRGHHPGEQLDPGQHLVVSHFATCPQGPAHRKPR